MAKTTKPTTQALATRGGETAIATHNPAQTFITRAVETGSNPESIAAMVDLWQMCEDRQAAKDLDAALAAFQAECPVVTKEKKGYGGHYKYATLPTIIEQVRPLLTKHSLSFQIDSKTDGTMVTAIVTLSQSPGGASRQSSFTVPIDDNKKNSMSTPQRYGAAVTFAKRYAFINALGILCADEDDDCFSPADKVDASIAGPDELANAKAKLWQAGAKIHGGDLAVFESFLQDQSIIEGALSDQGVEQLQSATDLVTAFIASQLKG